MHDLPSNTIVEHVLRLANESGLLRPSDLEKAGLSRRHVYRLCETGVLRRVDRGLYTAADAVESENSTFATVARRVPAAIFCLLSALRYHELTTQLPHEVWIALPPRARRPVISNLSLRVVRFSGMALSEGIAAHSIDGVEAHITTPARTVADCFRYRNKVGRDVAVEALRDVMEQGKATLGEIIHFAEVRRVSRVMQPYLEFYQ